MVILCEEEEEEDGQKDKDGQKERNNTVCINNFSPLYYFKNGELSFCNILDYYAT